MLARHQEEPRRLAKRGEEAGVCSEVQKVSYIVDLSVLWPQHLIETPTLALEEEHDTIPALVVALIAYLKSPLPSSQPETSNERRRLGSLARDRHIVTCLYLVFGRRH
jgi:hypothetical protein